MKLIINGTAFEDPFGIPWMKRNQRVYKEIDLSPVVAGRSFTFQEGPVIAGASLEDVGGTELDAELKASVLGFPIFDKKMTLIEHIGQGPQNVNVGGPQLGFSGTVQVTA